MLEELLAHPAVQAAAAPFAAALVVAIALRRSRFVGLAIAAAFVTLLALTIGLSFESLTATRKMVLVALALEGAALAPTRILRALLAAAAGAAAVWVALRVLQQRETSQAWLAGVAAAAYLAALIDAGHALRDSPVRAAACALLLGVAAAVIAFLGASAWLAQTGAALAAGAGAVLLVLAFVRTRAPAGWTLLLPASLIAGLVCLIAVFTGELRWYAVLPPLALPWLLALTQPRRATA